MKIHYVYTSAAGIVNLGCVPTNAHNITVYKSLNPPAERLRIITDDTFKALLRENEPTDHLNASVCAAVVSRGVMRLYDLNKISPRLGPCSDFVLTCIWSDQITNGQLDGILGLHFEAVWDTFAPLMITVSILCPCTN